MKFDFKTFESRALEIINWLIREYSGLRTGRATAALLDSIRVDAYGALVPINQVGSVSVEDARTLRVSAWDPSAVRSIEKAIIEADLGISVVTDSSGLRVIFPELTSERRAQILKLAKSKLEEARVSLRSARDEAIKQLEALNKDGGLSDDQKFSTKEELQKRMDAKNAELSKLYDLKETEINQ